jgi:hypothetical protein
LQDLVCINLLLQQQLYLIDLDYYQFVPSSPLAFNIDNLNYVAAGLIGGEFYLTITDSCNQVGLVPFIFTVCDTHEFNVFTPDGDGLNDVFEIEGLESFPGSQLRIFNRWGTMIFESFDYSNAYRYSAILDEYVAPWDAKDSEEGVYFWIFNRSDGISREGYVHVMHKKS